ncbi:hypothetical protein DNH61_06990 [Paenibacillus sambharensis]|uniref:Uncharacterized protein n=1 Tax=Paenibacillus sambharensis TaxID=1803190 RepID=A0A2W1LNN1_9BACL|nr:hypothetical protein [Paenibacillus sambharensis]PZD96542.1 hypothetical protein DNH61_06990 [Paenibacillus sambharensis]
MKQTAHYRKWIALLLAIVVAVPFLPSSKLLASGPVQGNSTHQLKYFQDRFPALTDPNHVFETVTYYELDYLLRNAPAGANDNYVILFGGSWQAETQAAIPHINEVAKEYGVTSIKTFDTRLAGPDIALDIAKNDTPYGNYTRRYVDLGYRYLKNINDHTAGVLGSHTYNYGTASEPDNQTVNVVDAPFLFIYNKGNADAPIIASLEGVASAGGLE